MGTFLMQHPDDIRRLELMRLAGTASRFPMHLGLDLASAHASLPIGSLLSSPLHPALLTSGLFYGSPYPSAAAVLNSSQRLRAANTAAPLPLSVTRSLVQTSRRGLVYANPSSSPIPSSRDSASAPVPTVVESYQRYQGETKLPPDFKPGPNSVIIGRKKNCYTSVGNLRLRDIVLMSLPAYSKCSKKKDKTEVVTSIVQMIRDSCPEGGAFVKCDSEGRWHEVSEVISRERVASIFRDFLHDQYRSSSKSKVAKRRENRSKQAVVSSDTQEKTDSVSDAKSVSSGSEGEN